jgi:photosystem II stability/assembly factor-like uncharacterized protein
VLNTNDTLVALWASPAGNLWATSARGMMWTTASVRWPPPTWAPLDYDVLDPKLPWTVTSLPKLARKRIDPIINAVWGVSDDFVLAGTFQGSIYVWNGSGWLEMPTPSPHGINHIHGQGAQDVWAVGERGTILHYDGKTWRRIPYPGDDDPTDGLTGVRALPGGEVVICGRAGRVLRGGRDGLEIVAEAGTSFYGVAAFRERLILAGRDAIFELIKNRVSTIRDTFGAVGAFECRNLLLFAEPNQEDGPGVVIYDPDAETPWSGSYLEL